MTTIPQAVTDYAARLVDARKKAYVASCIACWNQGQPFVSEWPNLAAEYITDIQAKLRKYGLTSDTRPVAQIEAPKSKVMSYNDYCYANGVSGHALDDADHSTYKLPNGVSAAAQRRMLKRTIANTEQWLADRARLRREYDAKVASGEIRPPTSDETIAAQAAGHPDLESTQAAIRVQAKRAARRSLSVVKAEPSRALAKPVKVVPFKPQKLARYTASKYAIEATLSGGNECYAGLITETMGGMPWGEAVVMYQSEEWQDRNRAALTQAKVYGLLAAPKATYGAEAAG